MRPANRPGALHARTNLHNAIPPGGADPHPGPPGSLPPGGPPVLSRRFPQAPLRRRRPAPSRAAAQPGRHTAVTQSFPRQSAPRPRMVPASRRTAARPRSETGRSGPTPARRAPVLPAGHRPHTGGPAHSPAPRPGWPAGLCPGALRYRQAPSAVRDSTPRAAPRPEAVKKLSQLTVSIPVTSRAPAPPPGGASFHIGRPWGTDGSPGRFPCTPPPQPVPPTR